MTFRELSSKDRVHLPVISTYLACCITTTVFFVINKTTDFERLPHPVKIIYYIGVLLFGAWMILDLIYPHEHYADKKRVVIHHVLTTIAAVAAVFFFKLRFFLCFLIIIQDFYPLFCRKFIEDGKMMIIIDLLTRFVGLGFVVGLGVYNNVPLVGYLFVIFIFYNNCDDFRFYHLRFFRSLVKGKGNRRRKK